MYQYSHCMHTMKLVEYGAKSATANSCFSLIGAMQHYSNKGFK